MTVAGDARYSGSKSTRSEAVSVSLGAAALSFQLHDGAIETWNYDTLVAEPPLGRRASEALLHPAGRPAETLWINDQALLAEIRRRAPHITAGRKARKWFMIAAALLLAIVGAYALIEATDARPARMIAKQLPEKMRVKFGEQLIGSMVAKYGRCTATDGQEALKALVRRFEPYRLSDELPWNVSVIGWPIANAFATPGGSIVLTKGLLAKAQSPDEVAGVLAHEIGHAQELHPEAGIVRALGVSLVIEFLTGGSGGMLTSLGTNVVLRGSSRNAEREADDRALELMRKERISPKGLRNFFARLSGGRARLKSATKDGQSEKKRGLGRAVFDMFKTHPGHAERIARIEAVEPYASRPSLADDQWRALKGICRQIEGRVERQKITSQSKK